MTRDHRPPTPRDPPRAPTPEDDERWTDAYPEHGPREEEEEEPDPPALRACNGFRHRPGALLGGMRVCLDCGLNWFDEEVRA